MSYIDNRQEIFDQVCIKQVNIGDFLQVWINQKHENIATRVNYIKENYEILDQMLNMLAESG